jgi:hypothetical protein
MCFIQLKTAIDTARFSNGCAPFCPPLPQGASPQWPKGQAGSVPNSSSPQVRRCRWDAGTGTSGRCFSFSAGSAAISAPGVPVGADLLATLSNARLDKGLAELKLAVARFSLTDWNTGGASTTGSRQPATGNENLSPLSPPPLSPPHLSPLPQARLPPALKFYVANHSQDIRNFRRALLIIYKFWAAFPE